MKYFLFSLISILLLFSWQATRFPVTSVEVPSVLCETRGDHFHSGVDFAGVQPVYPAADGEIIFYKDYYDNPTIPVFGSGDFLILGHNDNILSYYFHLKPGSIKKSLRKVDTTQDLAFVGSSGHSTGAHLHYVLVDMANKKVLNALNYMPKIKDKKKPVVKTLLTRINDVIYRMGDATHRTARFKWKGAMELIVIAYDIAPGRFPQIGPAIVGIKVDNVPYKELNFSYLKITEKGLTLPSGEAQKDVNTQYRFNYNMGYFTPTKAKHTFTVYCEDLNGNRDTKSFTVTFM